MAKYLSTGYLRPKQLGGLGFIDAIKRLQQSLQEQHGNDPICLKRDQDRPSPRRRIRK